MAGALVLPSESAAPAVWCRWAWLVSRQNTAGEQESGLLESIVRDTAAEMELRTTALSALWVTSALTAAAKIEGALVRHGQNDVALSGVLHPRWWHDEGWQDLSGSWVGACDDLDAAIWMIWAWANWPSPVVRVPVELLERTGLGKWEDHNWLEALRVGVARAENSSARSPFEAFWPQHIRDWVLRWLRWEEAVRLYRWRLAEEASLTRWSGSPPYPASLPPEPRVLKIALDTPMPPHNALYFTMLGLGYLLEKDSAESAPLWDSIWSSWASSLNYLTFEIQSNCQTTEWHIAGLTGALRDSYAMKRWGLSLD